MGYVLQRLSRRKGLVAIGCGCMTLVLFGQSMAQEYLPRFKELDSVNSYNGSSIDTVSQQDVNQIGTGAVSADSSEIHPEDANSVSNGEESDTTSDISNQKVEIHLEQEVVNGVSSSELVINDEDIALDLNGDSNQKIELDDGTTVRMRVRSDGDDASESSVRISVDSNQAQEGGE